MNNQFCISIHSLRMEGDAARTENCGDAGHFNPLPPHGGRQSKVSDWVEHFCISIHSLRMEGDNCFSVLFQRLVAFQSTPSAWRETIWSRSICFRDTFQSTPSAWRETSRILSGGNVMSHFNPLPPHGGRLQAYFSRSNSSLFQSTPSAWRETVRKMLLCRPCDFNPLPPHGGRRGYD